MNRIGSRWTFEERKKLLEESQYNNLFKLTESFGRTERALQLELCKILKKEYGEEISDEIIIKHNIDADYFKQLKRIEENKKDKKIEMIKNKEKSIKYDVLKEIMEGEIKKIVKETIKDSFNDLFDDSFNEYIKESFNDSFNEHVKETFKRSLDVSLNNINYLINDLHSKLEKKNTIIKKLKKELLDKMI